MVVVVSNKHTGFDNLRPEKSPLSCYFLFRFEQFFDGNILPGRTVHLFFEIMTTQKKSKSNRALPVKGVDWLHNPVFNKGTAFTEAERDALGLRGLLPPHVQSMDEQARRVMENFRSKSSDLERYIQIVGLQDRNETLFYRVVKIGRAEEHTSELQSLRHLV